jgi:hypothetical protein
VSHAGFTELQRVADLYSAFVALGGFDEMSPLSRPMVALAGAMVDVVFAQLPNDPAALGVIGRMSIAVDDWALVSVQGALAQRPQRALEPLPTSLELVPSVRKALRVKADLEPGASWYCIGPDRRHGHSSGCSRLTRQSLRSRGPHHRTVRPHLDHVGRRRGDFQGRPYGRSRVRTSTTSRR